MKPTIGALWAAGFAAWSAGARADCVPIPAGGAEPLAVACEDEASYSVRAGGEDHVWDKAAYRADLRARLISWLGAAAGRYAGGQVEVWLSVPEANPGGASVRALIRPAGPDAPGAPNFIVYLTLDPAGWKVEGEAVGILGAALYPQAFGYRAGELLVKTLGGKSAADTEAYLAPFGAADPAPFAAQWSLFHTAAFAEAAVRGAVEHDPGHSTEIEKMDYNQFVEWIAQRGVAFTFPLDAPN